ncbi:MAG: acetyl-CoA C-acyltransferase [Pseudomonadota bacterium]
MSQPSVVIVAARRTPIGSFQGVFAPLAAPGLAATGIRAVLDDTGIDPADLSQALVGTVLPAGIGQAPARQAALAGGVPKSVGCVTVNKVCGSGLQTVIHGADAIRAGSAELILAGGMESMTNAPYLLPKARGGLRMGHQEILDHMFYDGLQNPYDGQMMGQFGDSTAARYSFSREDQDAFAIASVERAQSAQAAGAFANEIAPVTVVTRKGQSVVDADEEPQRLNVEKIPSLRPAFAKDGTVTAASSSSISDGAAFVVLMSEDEASRRGLTPLARIVDYTNFAHEPEWFTTAPIGAIKKLHERTGLNPDSVDLYEINEAFACVTMAAMHDVGLAHEQVNVNGGACALGHPIGATGARILVTLLHALINRGGKRGIASLCLGGGEALAMAIERP